MLSENGPDIGVVIGTGPSITGEDLDIVEQAQALGKCRVFGMNHLWRDFPTLDYFLACNYEYYDYYWDEGLKNTPSSKWTWHEPTAKKYGINYLEGRWADGFSNEYLHLGHSSGFQAPGIAYYLGFRRMILLGYDMGYAKDYDGRCRRIGSTPRHYFGEYPQTLQHWPSVKVKNGVFTELIEQFEKVKTLHPEVEIINCSQNSNMKCFPIMSIDDAFNYFDR